MSILKNIDHVITVWYSSITCWLALRVFSYSRHILIMYWMTVGPTVTPIQFVSYIVTCQGNNLLYKCQHVFRALHFTEFAMPCKLWTLGWEIQIIDSYLLVCFDLHDFVNKRPVGLDSTAVHWNYDKINQSINQSINRSVNQSSNQSNQSVSHSTNQSINQSANHDQSSWILTNHHLWSSLPVIILDQFSSINR